MSQTLNFYELLKKEFNTLELFLPIVTRVHAADHPEFADISERFNRIAEKSKECSKEELNITDELAVIEGLTNNFSIPVGACEAYTNVYKALAQINQAYYNQK